MTTFTDLKATYPALFPETARIECGQGWAEIVGLFLADIAAISPLSIAGGFQVEAVREKMGGLRLEIAADPDFPADYTEPLLLAEFRSRLTCEECGKAGHVRKSGGGWYRCRCDEHSEPAERDQPPRPAWTIGRLTTKGFLWYDPAIDDVRYVDPASVGMPAHLIEKMEPNL